MKPCADTARGPARIHEDIQEAKRGRSDDTQFSERGGTCGRLGRLDDFVGAYLFLACESILGYISGQTVEVNGGQFMA